MFPTWLFYILISGLASVIFNYLNRYVLKDNDDSTSYGWWFEVIRTLLFLPFCFFVTLPSFTLFNSLLFLAIGLSEFFSVYVYMKMHSFSELSMSTIISQLRLIWTPLLAFIFLKESLTITEYIGIGLIVLGQVAVTSPKNLNFDKGIKYAFLSSILVATNSIIGKVAAPIFPVQFVMLAMGIPAIFGFPILMKNAKSRLKDLRHTAARKITVGVLFNAVTMIFMLLALKYGPVGKVIGVFQSTTILGIFVGIIFLNERGKILNKLIGSLSVVAGMFLLI